MLEEKLEKIFNQLGRIADALEVMVNRGTTDMPMPADDVQPEPTETPGPKASRGKAKPKTTAVDVDPVPAKTAGPAPTYNEVDVRGFLSKVLNTKGYEAAEKILDKYGVKKVKDLKATDYGAVVAECRDLVK